jgi:serine protease Do
VSDDRPDPGHSSWSPWAPRPGTSSRPASGSWAPGSWRQPPSGPPAPWAPTVDRGYQSAPPLAPTPTSPHSPPSEFPRPLTQPGYPPPPDQRSSGLGAALLGAVVGAVVAALVAGGLLLANEDDTQSGQTAVPTSQNLTIRGEGLDIQALRAKAQPSVVSIHTGESSSEFAGAGSGVVISADGLVLTNNHVVAGAERIVVQLYDGTDAEARLLGSFPENDIAMVQVEGRSDLVPATLGSSDELRVGDDVVAIGNALNLGASPTVTRGIVSSKDRTIDTPGGQLQNLIQTDAAINPGNSGGPLVNAQGEVVGINTAIIQGSQNIGFAIAIDAIKPLLDDLEQGTATVNPDIAYLGVSTVDVDSPDLNPDVLEQYGVVADEGALVNEVEANSAASRAGFEPGDVIVEIDGQPVLDSQTVGAIVREREPGDEVEIVYERRGQRETVIVTLGRHG